MVTRSFASAPVSRAPTGISSTATASAGVSARPIVPPTGARTCVRACSMRNVALVAPAVLPALSFHEPTRSCTAPGANALRLLNE